MVPTHIPHNSESAFFLGHPVYIQKYQSFSKRTPVPFARPKHFSCSNIEGVFNFSSPFSVPKFKKNCWALRRFHIYIENFLKSSSPFCSKMKTRWANKVPLCIELCEKVALVACNSFFVYFPLRSHYIFAIDIMLPEMLLSRSNIFYHNLILLKIYIHWFSINHSINRLRTHS